MSRGFGLLEVVIGVALITIIFFSLMGALESGVRLNERNLRRTQAAFLLSEGVEALKWRRASGWSTKIAPLLTSGSYSLYWQDGDWQATTTVSLIDGRFDRRFVLYPAYRDGNQDLASSGTGDLDTRRLVVTVSWLEGSATTTASTTTYITNLFSN